MRTSSDAGADTTPAPPVGDYVRPPGGVIAVRPADGDEGEDRELYQESFLMVLLRALSAWST